MSGFPELQPQDQQQLEVEAQIKDASLSGRAGHPGVEHAAAAAAEADAARRRRLLRAGSPPSPLPFSPPLISIQMMITQMKISQRCFDDCIGEFRTAKLTSDERECSQKCFQKYINATQRMAMRWAELAGGKRG